MRHWGHTCDPGDAGMNVGKEARRPAVASLSLIVLLAVLLAAALLPAALAGCGAGATDQNEPNDEPGDATVLTPGTPLDGVIGGSDDGDVFQCDAPAAEDGDGATPETGGDGATPDAGTSGAEAPHPFVVTVLTDAPDDIELQVGASIPDSWEGITWPGWDPVVKGDRLEVAAGLREGTVIMVLTGASGAEYSIEIVWE